MSTVYVNNKLYTPFNLDDMFDTITAEYPDLWDAIHYCRQQIGEMMDDYVDPQLAAECDAVMSTEEHFQSDLMDIKGHAEKIQDLVNRPKMTANVKHDIGMFADYIIQICKDNNV